MKNLLLFLSNFNRCLCVGLVVIAYAIAGLAHALARVFRWVLIAAIGLLALPFILAGLACVVVVLVLAIPFALIL
jgi:hypothetical protein